DISLRAVVMCMLKPEPAPDFVVDVATSPARPLAGQPLTYTITIANHGGATVDSQLDDTLPAGAAFVSVDDQRCAAVFGGVQCQLGAFAAGATQTIKIVVMPNSAGPAFNRAVVSSFEQDAAPGDNTVDTTTDVKAFPVATPALAATAPGTRRLADPLAP